MKKSRKIFIGFGYFGYISEFFLIFREEEGTLGKLRNISLRFSWIFAY